MGAARRISRQERNARRAATEESKVGKFALLSETLLLGVCLFVLALPVVTAPAAYAAGAAHMERHISGRSDSFASLWADFREALPGSWKFGLAVLGLLFVGGVNLLLSASAQLPGGTLVLGASVILAAGAAVLLLRTAALWQHHREGRGLSAAQAWMRAWAQAKAESVADVVGTILLLAALIMSVSFVWMLPPLVFIVPGVLVLAAVSVRYRRAARVAG